ncbi:uncharacterized protein LOC120919385 isoform X2 [Rana temporaria]|uniref:uncharacterized protein LOC120919385 isoform X2 n=1 Tax=Rana temporaria TaxID=8407 RepID=UPI001AAD7131|nr:uncharacterized protein LOC120919385 isoform X2 [Rana temporaria]
MILQYRVCQTKHILLFISGLFLGVSQILLVEGSVAGSSTRADLKSTTITVTNSTSIYDFQSQNTSTEKPIDQATSEATNGSVFPVFHTVSEAPDNSETITQPVFSTSPADTKAPDSGISETTSDELFTNNSTTATKGTTTPLGRALIGCLVGLFFIIIISCLAYHIINKRKMSYSLNYNKHPEDSEIPLNNMKA